MTNPKTTRADETSMARMAVIAFAMLQILTPMLPSLGVGQPIGSQSDAVRTIITPAGWAFSIWGPLYGGSLVFAIYQALPAQQDNALMAKLRWPAAGAFAGNAAWAAYTQIFGLSALSAVIIIFTLGCLLAAYRAISAWKPSFSSSERWFAVVPLSALAAWLTAATIVNVAASLRFHGVEAGNESALIGAIVLGLGGIIAAGAVIRGQGNPPYALVFLWALTAIYAAGGQRSDAIATAAGIAALLVVSAAIVGYRRAGAHRWLGTDDGR